jgi:hypothetical protein
LKGILMIIHSINIAGIITVLTDKRSIAELSSVIPIENLDGQTFYFHRIKVLPQYEGTGEGRELMIEVCKQVDKLNAKIYNPLNPYGKRNLNGLKSFFRASGFEMLEEPSIMIRRSKIDKEKPYLLEEKTIIIKMYNRIYGDDRICQCGHKYYRHFDSYNDMSPCGCKYCDCYIFIKKELTNEISNKISRKT